MSLLVNRIFRISLRKFGEKPTYKNYIYRKSYQYYYDQFDISERFSNWRFFRHVFDKKMTFLFVFISISPFIIEYLYRNIPTLGRNLVWLNFTFFPKVRKDSIYPDGNGI